MPCLNCGSNGRENCFCEECFKDESKNPKDILPKYMQASTAYHMLGDLSRKKDVCLVTRENEKYYIGHWLDYVTNNRFVSLLFPKSECQEIKISKNRIIVRTLNSTYLFGEENSEGTRSVERKEETLLFASCKIKLLVEGKIMILSFDKDLWYTSKVKRIELLE